MLSVNPNLTPGDVESILSYKADDVTQEATAHSDAASLSYDFATGAEFVDAFQACLLAESRIA